jgi:hypothetical protein
MRLSAAADRPTIMCQGNGIWWGEAPAEPPDVLTQIPKLRRLTQPPYKPISGFALIRTPL